MWLEQGNGFHMEAAEEYFKVKTFHYAHKTNVCIFKCHVHVGNALCYIVFIDLVLQ